MALQNRCNPFHMDSRDLERAYDDRKYLVAGGSIPEELGVFVKLKELAFEYRRLAEMPKNVEELREQVSRERYRNR